MQSHFNLDIRAGLAGVAPLLLDGAMGSQLLNSGFSLERDFLGVEDGVEVLNLSRPEQVRAIHESYFDAGADLVITNTFMALPSVLADCGMDDRLEEIALAAVRSARIAADAWSTEARPRAILGGLGPGLDLPSQSGRSADAVRVDFDRAVESLVQAGVDGFLLETCADPLQITQAVRAARRGGDGVLMLSLLPGKAPLAEVVAAARDQAVDLLAFNCGNGPQGMPEALAQLRDLWDGPLGCWPNAGAVDGGSETDSAPLGPDEFASQMGALVKRFDLALVGGCCGTSPAHVRALARELGRGDQDDFYLGDDPIGECPIEGREG